MNLTSRFLLALVVCLGCLSVSPVGAAPPQSRPNVLFIAVDDLRPELNCYGRTHMHSPNIDALASSGILFQRAYCMVPTCGASRASLMTGIRPARGRFVNYLARADQDSPGTTTLNTHFKNNGYTTLSRGKVFHHVGDSQRGWSQPAWRPKVNPYRLEANRERQRRKSPTGKRLRGPALESSESEDDEHPDGITALKAIEDLQRLSKEDRSFFLAVGFVRPHLPFVAPKKYWDLYDRSTLKLPANYKIPQGAPKAAIHSFGELRSYDKIPPRGPLSDDMARQLIHGYYACVSFTDAQVGRVLAELERLELDKNTIVVLWGDHGWNLGDHTLWCKHSCFESSMHAPLIVRVPGIQGGVSTDGLTEFIDLYPSLCELTGMPKPDHLQGDSFVSLLHHPNQAWKESAIGRYQSGDTIRTDRYRYTKYRLPGGAPPEQMLYDHSSDPLENVNIANEAATQQQAKNLAGRLQEGMGRDVAKP